MTAKSGPACDELTLFTKQVVWAEYVSLLMTC